MAKWIIQFNNISQTQSTAVSDAVKSAGGELTLATVVPIKDLIEFWGKKEPGGKDLIPYGSTGLRRLAVERGWSGVFFNENFDTDIWPKNRDDMLNHDAVVMTFAESLEYLKDRSPELRMFIRPRRGGKIFAGMVRTVGEIRQWSTSLTLGHVFTNPESEVSIAPSKQIDAETRWFIVDGKVIDGSVYRLRGQSMLIHVEDEAVIKEAQTLADKWLPMSTCVMDTAETPEGLKVIEFNCFNTSGFYKNDIPKVISAVNALFN